MTNERSEASDSLRAPDPDRELVVRAIDELPHQTSAYQALVERHQRSVYRRAYRILGSSEDAEDATQEAFLSVFRSIRSYRFDRPFAHWLSKIALNTCLLFLRRRKREARRREAASRESAIQRGQAHAPSDPFLRTTLEGVLGELSPTARVAIVLRVLEERSYPEIAEQLQMKESAVKMQVARGIRRLRELISERNGSQP